MVFPVVRYRCESWTIKKAECWRNIVFKLWCWRRVESLRQQGLKSVNPKENQPWIFIGRMDTEATIFFATSCKIWLIEKDTVDGKIVGIRRRGWKRMRWLDNITASMSMNLSKLWQIVKDRGAWHTAVYGVTKSRMRLIDWTTATEMDSELLIVSLRGYHSLSITFIFMLLAWLLTWFAN